MTLDNRDLELAQLRGQVKAANRLIGSLIANLEKNASYKLTLTLRDEVNDSLKESHSQVSERDEIEMAEVEAEVEYINQALEFSETLRWRPFRLN